MRTISQVTTTILTTALLALPPFCLVAGGLTGCQDGKVVNPLEKDRVAADVDIAGEMVQVEASGNAHCEAGVKHLRAENWDAAAEELKIATTENPKDWRAAYALGIAYERMGKKAEALQVYEKANLNVEGEGDSDITAAILRLKASP